MMRTRPEEHGEDSITFPIEEARKEDPPTETTSSETEPFALTALPESAGEVFEAIESMSRRIDDLAKELGCLGFFDDDDGPRAA